MTLIAISCNSAQQWHLRVAAPPPPRRTNKDPHCNSSHRHTPPRAARLCQSCKPQHPSPPRLQL
ncbi:hypothetical protein HHK36_004920 [Tetracentron sinense]|uniref:Uncharacterized protein n=1 Tax=Tetracentron sinense TaxID=13715 RepID=A0A834ZKQ0_TETSI|nr:hypothetical protein HHK36_004920 [Tetracentron sinense]